MARGSAANAHCPRCLESGRELGPHHVFGRRGDNLYSFALICRVCHREIHDDEAKAKKEGWLA
jgi:hypothetical protein